MRSDNPSFRTNDEWFDICQKQSDKIKELEAEAKQRFENETLNIKSLRDLYEDKIKELEAELKERQVCHACGEEIYYKSKIILAHDIRVYEDNIKDLHSDLKSANENSLKFADVIWNLKDENTKLHKSLNDLINTTLKLRYAIQKALSQETRGYPTWQEWEEICCDLKKVMVSE